MKFPLVTRARLNAANAQASALAGQICRLQGELQEARNAFSRSQEFQGDQSAFSRIIRSTVLASLTPIATCENIEEWKAFVASEKFRSLWASDEEILSKHRHEEYWSLTGYSLPAEKIVNFKVDLLGSGKRNGDIYLPDVRERLECPVTHLNNRQRLVAGLLAAELSRDATARRHVYFMEQVTAIFSWATAAFPGHDIVGSEYLGDSHQSGAIIDGIRHENLQDLSFEESSLDLIISNDVMEHVPSPEKAFAEMARVMRPNAQAVMTFPFYTECDHSVTRATLTENGVNHLLEPVYHGNPVSKDGSLVFTDPAWDMFDVVKSCGFTNIVMEIYNAPALGHLGLGTIFRLTR